MEVELRDVTHLRRSWFRGVKTAIFCVFSGWTTRRRLYFQAASNYYQACRKHRQQKLAEEAAAADEQPRTIQGVRKEREREK